MKKLLVLISMMALVIVSGGAVAACGGDDSTDGGGGGGDAPDTVKIGLIEALSGAAADYGAGSLHGAELAVKHINESGGIEGLGGAKLQLETYDLQSDPAMASGLAQQAVDDGNAAVLGAALSDAVIAGTNVTQRAGVPWINIGALADQITERDYDTVFATQGSATQVAEANVEAFKAIGEQLGKPVQTVAITYIGLAYGEELYDRFVEAAEDQYDIVAAKSYPAETTDFGAIAASVANENPDIVYNIGFSPDGIAFGKAVAQTGAKPTIAFFQGVPPQTAIEEAKGASESWTMRLDLREEYDFDSKSFKDFFSGYRKEFGIAPENTSDNSYTAIMAIRAAMNEAGSADPEDVKEALSQVALTGDDGNIYPKEEFTFGENGLVDSPTIGIVQIQGGKVQTVWPGDLATSDPVPYGTK